jgi:hypothetical protein
MGLAAAPACGGQTDSRGPTTSASPSDDFAACIAKSEMVTGVDGLLSTLAAHRGTLYYASTPGGGSAAVYAVSTKGGTPALLSHARGVERVWFDGDALHGVTYTGQVVAIPADGSDASSIGGYPVGASMRVAMTALDDQYVYVAGAVDSDHSLRREFARAPRAGGDVQVLYTSDPASGDSVTFDPITVDDAHVITRITESKSLVAIPKSGGKPIPLDGTEQFSQPLDADARGIWVAAPDPAAPTAAPTALEHFSPAGSERFAEVRVPRLAVRDGDVLYVIAGAQDAEGREHDVLWRIAANTAPTRIGCLPDDVFAISESGSLAVDEDNVYVATLNPPAIFRIPR